MGMQFKPQAGERVLLDHGSAIVPVAATVTKTTEFRIVVITDDGQTRIYRTRDHGEWGHGGYGCLKPFDESVMLERRTAHELAAVRRKLFNGIALINLDSFTNNVAQMPIVVEEFAAFCENLQAQGIDLPRELQSWLKNYHNVATLE